MPACALRHVFVYGTLRRGDVRDITRLQPAPQFIGMASVAGVLYDLGPYPGLLLGGESRVTGEVYAITTELERLLDQIEEVWPQQTGEYSKRELAVQMDEDGARTVAGPVCLVYEINASRVDGCPVIPSGDWRRRTLAS
ncbi:MAG: gamma-glutamylcyclotransferase family protein [Hydrogenophaga sp.]|uniref:gamma-glutamylcyclotransferase family protein n=1 Tax=Polaromonas sp. TaxID=1869339 RepID=UPI00272F161F|nr:gamma-glutamylcyclotransferase family protein [Polaromonas sp.]MDP1740354.1 gamma-glutamylcyclotransferase family protein [Polaromonas sp.]MDP1955430.1 gamma-glutamylcyclotransferase family protein [Polaromonas sp.]MDP3166219.1 gamma-glutamylcyclotransferase family protein [Hydrogenophaga sp.]MDP3753178.1 gamma-glutamylcyclotransferase family protein [Polaromonas sp.]